MAGRQVKGVVVIHTHACQAMLGRTVGRAGPSMEEKGEGWGRSRHRQSTGWGRYGEGCTPVAWSVPGTVKAQGIRQRTKAGNNRTGPRSQRHNKSIQMQRQVIRHNGRHGVQR